jgi:hypothetical protein
VGDSIPISDRANKKDTIEGDQVYLGRQHTRHGWRRELPELDSAGAHGGSRKDGTDWPAATMVARCWGRPGSGHHHGSTGQRPASSIVSAVRATR